MVQTSASWPRGNELRNVVEPGAAGILEQGAEWRKETCPPIGSLLLKCCGPLRFLKATKPQHLIKALYGVCGISCLQDHQTVPGRAGSTHLQS